MAGRGVVGGGGIGGGNSASEVSFQVRAGNGKKGGGGGRGEGSCSLSLIVFFCWRVLMACFGISMVHYSRMRLCWLVLGRRRC